VELPHAWSRLGVFFYILVDIYPIEDIIFETMGKNRKKMAVSETLREAILKSGISLYRIAKNASVGYASLHRFANCKGAVSLEVFDKLCGVLDLELMRRENDNG